MKESTTKTLSKISLIVGIVLLVIFVPMLILNLVIIFKGMNSVDPPSVFGVTPLVVSTGSMTGDDELSFPMGSMIFITKCNPDELKEGDVITFRFTKDANSITTHRIYKVTVDGDGKKCFETKGDWNNAYDQENGASPYVYPENVIGQYKGAHINGVGYLFDFIQKPVGMLVFIGIPVLAFMLYEVLSWRAESSKKAAVQAAGEAQSKAELEQLKAELEALKGAKASDKEGDDKEGK